MKKRTVCKFWGINNSINHFFDESQGNSQGDLILSFLKESVEDPYWIEVRVWRKMENEAKRQTLEEYERKTGL